MSKETMAVIEAQTRVMEMDLQITLQRMKIAELKQRAKTLVARAELEEHKLNGTIKTREELDEK